MADADRPKPLRPCKCRNRDPCARNCIDNYTPPPQLRTPVEPPPMLGLSPRQDQGDHSLLVTGMTIMGSMICSALILCVFFTFARLYFNRRINQSRRRSFPDGFFGSRDGFFLDEDQIMPHLDNPTWYINTIGLEQSVIDSITVFKYKKDGGMVEGTECSVCLNEFQEDESLRLLPKCTHGFHLPCIDTWLRTHQNCPLCRAPIVSDAMVAQTSALEPNSNGSGSNNETAVENDVGEGGTSACRFEDGNTSENSRKILGHSDGNILSDLDEIQATRRSVSLDLTCSMDISGEATTEHKHGCSLDSELEQLQYDSNGKIGVKQSCGSSSICKLIKSSSVGRSLSKVPVSVTRSVSSAGMFLLSKPESHFFLLPPMFNLWRWSLFYMVTVVVVTAQPTPTVPLKDDSYALYSRFDPSMVIVVMVLVGAFFLVGFLSVYIRHCNEAHAMAAAAAAAAAYSSQMFGTKGLDRVVIESFPIFVYSDVKHLKLGKAALECAVCLSEFDDDETLRLIPKCCHVFHPDCIDAWLAYHVTCPVCRATLTPDSDANAEQVESYSNTTELNSNNHNSNPSSPPTTPRAEVQNELNLIIQINETKPTITGKFPRSNSTGHSLIQPGESTERFTLRLPEEIRKQIAKSGRLKRTRSYDAIVGMEVISKKGEGSSKGKSMTDRWVFSMTPPFVSKTCPIKSPKGGSSGGCGDGGDVSSSWIGLTSVKEKLRCLHLKVEQIDKEGSSSWPQV